MRSDSAFVNIPVIVDYGAYIYIYMFDELYLPFWVPEPFKYAYMHLYTYTCTYIHIYIYTHIHIHTFSSLHYPLKEGAAWTGR